MIYEQVNSKDEALFYLVECQLATVSHMAGLKSRGDGEYARQIRIAQKGVDLAQKYSNREYQRGYRLYEIVNNHNVSVADWVRPYDVKQT